MEPNENGVFVCIEPGCSNLATINSKTGKPANGRCGECQSRIMRQARGKKAGEVAVCLVPGCEGRAQCRGLCNHHYAAWRRGAIDELLGPWFQGPGQPTVRERKEDEKEMEHAEMEPEYAVQCRDCGHEASGTHEEVARHFQPNNLAVKGFDSVCRKCKAAKIKQGWHLAKRVRSEEEKTRANQVQGKVVVDLERHRAVYDALEAMARREFRSVEQQAAWVLKDALEAEGYLDRESGAV